MKEKSCTKKSGFAFSAWNLLDRTRPRFSGEFSSTFLWEKFAAATTQYPVIRRQNDFRTCLQVGMGFKIKEDDVERGDNGGNQHDGDDVRDDDDGNDGDNNDDGDDDTW